MKSIRAVFPVSVDDRICRVGGLDALHQLVVLIEGFDRGQSGLYKIILTNHGDTHSRRGKPQEIRIVFDPVPVEIEERLLHDIALFDEGPEVGEYTLLARSLIPSLEIDEIGDLTAEEHQVQFLGIGSFRCGPYVELDLFACRFFEPLLDILEVCKRPVVREILRHQVDDDRLVGSSRLFSDSRSRYCRGKNQQHHQIHQHSFHG